MSPNLGATGWPSNIDRFAKSSVAGKLNDETNRLMPNSRLLQFVKRSKSFIAHVRSLALRNLCAHVRVRLRQLARARNRKAGSRFSSEEPQETARMYPLSLSLFLSPCAFLSGRAVIEFEIYDFNRD